MNKLVNNTGPDIPSSWEELKTKCKDWTVQTSGKRFYDINSDKCAVISAFSSNGNSEWKNYLGYYETFKSEKWDEGDKKIDYSNNSSGENNYKKLFEKIKSSSKAINDSAKSTEDGWNPSKPR